MPKLVELIIPSCGISLYYIYNVTSFDFLKIYPLVLRSDNLIDRNIIRAFIIAAGNNCFIVDRDFAK